MVQQLLPDHNTVSWYSSCCQVITLSVISYSQTITLPVSSYCQTITLPVSSCCQIITLSVGTARYNINTDPRNLSYSGAPQDTSLVGCDAVQFRRFGRH